MNNTPINAFWRWFEREVLPSLVLDQIPGDAVIRELDELTHGLGVSWELGPSPDGSDDWGLAISFGAEAVRLPAAQAVVEQAPRMKKCQVILGKPPKQWDGVLELPLGDDWVRVSTADWLCIILPMAGGMAIMVIPEGAEDLDESTTALAAAIAVESELGELRYSREVRDLSVVSVSQTASLPGIRCRMRELGSGATSGRSAT